MSSVINTSNTSTTTQSSNVSTTTTIISISTTTTSSILLTTTTTPITTTTTTPITTTTSITTSNSFFTDTNSNSFTTTNSKNFPTTVSGTVSGTVPSISTLIPEENITSDENNNDIDIFGAVFGTILLALFGCIFLIYFIRRKKDKEKENVLVYNPNRSSGLIDNSGINDIQKTTVQPQNRSSNYAGENVELVEITDYNNNTQSNLFVPFNNVSNSDNLNIHQIQQNNELQNMYNNTVQMNLVNNIADDGIKFAETMNRDSLENNNYKNKNNSGITRSLNLPV